MGACFPSSFFARGWYVPPAVKNFDFSHFATCFRLLWLANLDFASILAELWFDADFWSRNQTIEDFLEKAQNSCWLGKCGLLCIDSTFATDCLSNEKVKNRIDRIRNSNRYDTTYSKVIISDWQCQHAGLKNNTHVHELINLWNSKSEEKKLRFFF